MSGPHVVVIGSGIIGLCSAHALLRRGFRVTVLDREERPEKGCSWGNGGLIVPSHFQTLAAPGMIGTGIKMLRSRESPFGFSKIPNLEMLTWMAQFAKASSHAHVARCAPVLRDLNLASRALYEGAYSNFAAGYDRRGELMICQTEKALAGETHLAEEAAGLGLATEVLDRKGLAAMEKGIEIDAAGAVYFQDDAHLTPYLFMPALRSQIAKEAEVVDGAEVTEFVTEGNQARAVKTKQGEIEADEFVLATGAWTGLMAERVGLRLPLLAGKGYGFTIKNPPQTPNYPAILTEGRVAVTPMADGVRFVGTMELGPPSSPSSNEYRLQGMRKSIRSGYPAFRDFDLDSVETWAGLRPVTPDGMPYIGRTRKLEGLTIATGHGMMGMSLGPISGELVAQTLANEKTSIPLDLMSPDRYV